ncbi:MAG: NAD-dependent epimerase/dehydratase family protein [Lachnospiraceae bacterium]|nr:NAD-dependent epimerase/dehydratase family protein [Lachnospiraceae bacterium]
MNILVTGAKGFLGRNLIENLKNIRDGKDRTRPELHIDEIYEFDVDSASDELRDFCSRADFVFNLAGVNRPQTPEEYMKGNFGFASGLLDMLSECGSSAPVMLSSSIQAELTGRFANSEYGRSKLEGEKLFFDYGRKHAVRTLVYRFPNIFGKWCRPNYNSVVATFCYNIGRELDIRIDDPATELELVYIDDVVCELLDALEGKEHRNGEYCYVPVTYHATLGEIADLLREFHNQPGSLIMPDIPDGSFAKKLYSTYLSYLPPEKAIYDIPMSEDERGHFTELIKSRNAGQISINISRPGVVKGQHWHNSKWEIFIVVSGHGLIQERRLGIDPSTGLEYPVHEFEVSGAKIQAVQMLPGYTHNIINLSETEDLVTVMWANEIFDEAHPETYREIVDRTHRQE